MKTTIFAIVAVLFLSIGSFSQQLSYKSVDNGVNPGINPPENIAINNTNNMAYRLLSFTVSSTRVGNLWTTHLNWTAVGESQITGYELERMTTNSKFWTGIAYFPGSNRNDLITRNYSETFIPSGSVTIFYRLKIYYVNSTFQYSQVVSVTIG